MTMLRNAGSLKNDKKFNMREIVIDTETTGLDPLRLKQSMRQEHQPTSSYQRRTIRVTTAAVSAESKDPKGASFKTPPKDRLRVGPSLPVSKMS